MTMSNLRQEYEDRVIGEEILRILHEITWSVTKKYDPKVYGGAASWDEAHDDLLQAFVADVLLGDNQLAYAILTAESEQHFKNLLARQLRFFLARSRRRTVVDNLLDRCKELTAEEPFEQNVEQRTWSYYLRGKQPADRRPTVDELAQLAGELAVFPIRQSSGLERAPRIYQTEDLKRLLLKVASRLGCRVSVGDLDDIFHRLLTPWLPTFLEKSDGITAVQKEPSLDAERVRMARQAVTAIRKASTPVELEILALKIANVADSAIGQRLNMSRPTVIKYKKRVLATVEAELSELSQACQVRAIELLAMANDEGSEP